MKQFWLRALLLLAAAIVASPVAAFADQSSQPAAPAAGHIAAGTAHSCAIVPSGARCWGFGANRRLGYGTLDSIGDDESPGSVGPLSFGPGLTATAISAGGGHTCALLSDATVRCWGVGGDGRLGYVSTASSPPGQPPGAAGAVDVGGPVKAISAGASHTCALLTDGTVRCWGYGGVGQLGYSKPDPTSTVDPPSVGDDETPASAGPVNLGVGRTATAISAGTAHTCALLDDGTVRCWGYGGYGALGYADTATIGDNETPNTVGPVYLGIDAQTGLPHKATAISAGTYNTCALLDDGTARCWGDNLWGQLGRGNTSSVGVTQRPGDVAPINLGGPAKAIVAGDSHTCAIMQDGALRCWGQGHLGQLGSGNTASVGDDEPPVASPPVALGPGRTAVAVEAGELHTCALLDDASVRCWGFGSAGRLGYCSQITIGEDELPTVLPPVGLAPGAGCPGASTPADGGPATPVAPVAPVADPPAARGTVPATSTLPDAARAAQAARRQRLRTCLRTASRRAKAVRPAARRACLRRHGRTPGKVTRVRATATAPTRVVLTFDAPGSDGRKEPAARRYLVRQSLRPLRSARDVSRAAALCRSSCRFSPTEVGAKITLTVTGLRPATTYYYVVAARDNVSGRLGPRSAVIRVRTPPSTRRG